MSARRQARGPWLNLHDPDRPVKDELFKPFAGIPHEVFSNPALKDQDIRVLGGLIKAIFEEGPNPPVEKVSRYCLKPVRSVYTAYGRLAAAGVIETRKDEAGRYSWVALNYYLNNRYKEAARAEVGKERARQARPAAEAPPGVAPPAAQIAPPAAQIAPPAAQIAPPAAHSPTVRTNARDGKKEKGENDNVTSRALARDGGPGTDPEEADPSPEQVAEWERLGANKEDQRAAAVMARAMLAAWKSDQEARAAPPLTPQIKTLAELVPAPPVAPVAPPGPPAPPPRVGTEDLIRRVPNPAFGDDAVEEAARRLAEVFDDPRSLNCYRGLCRALRAGGLTVPRFLRALRKSRSPSAYNPAGVFVAELKAPGPAAHPS